MSGGLDHQLAHGITLARQLGLGVVGPARKVGDRSCDVQLRPPVATEGQSWLATLSSTPEVRVAEVARPNTTSRLDVELSIIIADDFKEGDGGAALQRLADAGFVDVLAECGVREPTGAGALRARLDHVLIDKQFEPLDGEVLDAGRPRPLVRARASVAQLSPWILLT